MLNVRKIPRKFYTLANALRKTPAKSVEPPGFSLENICLTLSPLVTLVYSFTESENRYTVTYNSLVRKK
jgi:hypothetical protein